MPDTTLSDGACSIFAFAAYHQLQSGQPVTKVVIDDGAGHKADDRGREELTSRDLAKEDGNALVFSESGLAVLAKAVSALKAAVG